MGFMGNNVIVIDNPLAKHYVTVIRSKETPPMVFRSIVRKLGFILGYELSRFLQWSNVFVETPLARAKGVVPGNRVIIVGILGASIPLVEGMWEALPWAGLGLVAAKRIEEEDGVKVLTYYTRLPDDLSEYTVVIADPMLATGKTIDTSIEFMKERRAREVIIASIISSKPGIEFLLSKHKSIKIITIEVDPKLNSKWFIVPGLGDAGDRGLGIDLKGYSIWL